MSPVAALVGHGTTVNSTGRSVDFVRNFVIIALVCFDFARIYTDNANARVVPSDNKHAESVALVIIIFPTANDVFTVSKARRAFLALDKPGTYVFEIGFESTGIRSMCSLEL